MPFVEVFEGEKENQPLFVAEFDFMPRIGDYVSRDAGGHFLYYNVVETWHRQDGDGGSFRACIRVKGDD